MKKAAARFLKNILVASVCFTVSTAGAQSKSYQQEIDTWHQQRENALRQPAGWLNLAGLFWLQEGKNSFGSAAGSTIVFKHRDMPATAGYFERKGDIVTWIPATGVNVLVKGRPATTMTAFELDKPAPLFELSHFRWNLIRRDDKIGIRFRDLESAAVKTFKGVERFKVDSNWRFPARLEQGRANVLAITNVLGQTSNQPLAGQLVFTIDKKEYRLDALAEGEELFIIFGDATSGKATYPAGRFLYVKKPLPGEMTVIDFNKAINPPCAFTDFATCPLPPPQNILPMAVNAGEKTFGHPGDARRN